MARNKKGLSVLNLIHYCVEFTPQQEIKDIPAGLHLRGIYALFKEEKKNSDYRVVYIGISTSDIRNRLLSHAIDKNKKGWSHFSLYKVWPNVTDQEIKELEGLFLSIYRKDKQAQQFNKNRSQGLLRSKRIKNLKERGEEIRKFEKQIRYFPKLRK